MARSEELAVTEHRIDSLDGAKISVWQIADRGNTSTDRPAVVYAHGGGFVTRPINMNEVDLERFRIKQMGKGWIERSGVVLLYVSYRLAREKPFPAAPDDVCSALKWAMENTAKLGINGDKIGLMGCSAGGNLALTAALRARDEGLAPPVCGLMLIYPMLDPDTNWACQQGVGFLSGVRVWWDKLKLRYFWTVYHWNLKDLSGEDKKYVRLLSNDCDLAGLPRTYTDVGSKDYFLEEDQRLMERLTDAGVPLEYTTWEGMPHGFEESTPNEEDLVESAPQTRRRWWQQVFES